MGLEVRDDLLAPVAAALEFQELGVVAKELQVGDLVLDCRGMVHIVEPAISEGKSGARSRARSRARIEATRGGVSLS